MHRIIIILTTLFLSLNTHAQILKLEDAIATALQNNHNIVLVKQQNAANHEDIHAGNAGLMPKVDAVGSASYSSSISNQEFATNAFPAVEGVQAASASQQAQLQASYMLFNGLGNFRTYAKLKEGGKLSDLQTKLSIESTLLQVVSSYYEVVRLSEQLALIDSSLLVSKDRLNRVNYNYSFGSGSKIEQLNAQVDFLNDSSTRVTTLLSLNQAKHQLNFLIGKAPNTAFEIDGTVELPVLESLNNYSEKAKTNNTSLLLTEVQLSMSDLDIKLNQSSFMPTIMATANYGYNGNQNEVGVVQKSSSLGFTAGVSLNWNLFDGFKKQHALEKAKILLDVNETKRNQAVLQVEMELMNAYEAAQTYLSLIELESKNLELAQLNLSRSKELFYNGTINNVQFRQAQLNLIQIQNKINNYKYMTKIYEFQILRLTNGLIK